MHRMVPSHDELITRYSSANIQHPAASSVEVAPRYSSVDMHRTVPRSLGILKGIPMLRESYWKTCSQT